MLRIASGGEVPIHTPEELMQRADVVIVGLPTKIELTEKKGHTQFHGGKIIPLQYYEARVRIGKVIKGEGLGEELSITYSNQIDATHAVSRIWLREGEQSLLYLRRAENGKYVGALEGELHDGQAASPLEIIKGEQIAPSNP